MRDPHLHRANLLRRRASGEMADALASGASVRKDVGVQVPPRAHETKAPARWRRRTGAFVVPPGDGGRWPAADAPANAVARLLVRTYGRRIEEGGGPTVHFLRTREVTAR